MHILEHLQCKMSNQFTESIKTFGKKKSKTQKMVQTAEPV